MIHAAILARRNTNREDFRQPVSFRLAQDLSRHCITSIAQKDVKFLGNRAARVGEGRVCKMGDSSRTKRHFNYLRTLPFYRQPVKIEAVQETLDPVIRKTMTRSIRYTHIYIADTRVMKFLGTDKYLESAILHLSDSLVGLTPT
jgi:hypothetical protein